MPAVGRCEPDLAQRGGWRTEWKEKWQMEGTRAAPSAGEQLCPVSNRIYIYIYRLRDRKLSPSGGGEQDLRTASVTHYFFRHGSVQRIRVNLPVNIRSNTEHEESERISLDRFFDNICILGSDG